MSQSETSDSGLVRNPIDQKSAEDTEDADELEDDLEDAAIAIAGLYPILR